MKTKDYYQNIANQERKSSELWRKTDRETSHEEIKESVWQRVLNRVKSDEEMK